MLAKTMKTKIEFLISGIIAVVFFAATTVSSGVNKTSSLEERLSTDIQKNAVKGIDIIKNELSNAKMVLLVESSGITYEDAEGEILKIYKDETGLAVLKESTGIANVLSIQLEELNFNYNPDTKTVDAEIKTQRNITHSSGDKVYYSGSASAKIFITN